jgi:ribonuclease HII
VLPAAAAQKQNIYMLWKFHRETKLMFYFLPLSNMLKSFYREGAVEAGLDEAGRGCLAGPVFAAAVILPVDFSHPLLNDSKKMTERARDILRAVIEREAVAWAVEAVSAARIDCVNILNASFEAMEGAAAKILTAATRPEERPELLLVDGNRFRTQLDIPYLCIVGGDGLYSSIAAASVLAKTHRDEYMKRLAAEFPEYGWLENKGYPTRHHREAIARHGLSPHHRVTFRNEKG